MDRSFVMVVCLALYRGDMDVLSRNFREFIHVLQLDDSGFSVLRDCKQIAKRLEVKQSDRFIGDTVFL